MEISIHLKSVLSWSQVVDDLLYGFVKLNSHWKHPILPTGESSIIQPKYLPFYKIAGII